ncbi:hypothetical protein K438DRAFT_1764977 [Mycena galopus ATCC 62051]|nr:hypothetical protein K438DRAFT_1764977 [Mycena galopus ATCC 62051]
MSSILHDFALAWNSGLRFFLDSSYSPLLGVPYPPIEPDILGSQDGASHPSRLLLYGPPRRSLPRNTALSERSNQREFWLWLWLWTSWTRSIQVVTPPFLSVLDHVLPYQGFYEPRRFHRLQRDLASYPLDWSVAELAHQHFLALASLGLWHVEIRGRMNWQIQVCWPRTSFSRFLPEPLDVCLDKMCLWFQDCLRAWRKAKDSNRGIAETWWSLFFFVLGMESALLCLNHHGVRVSWSPRYERLMHRLLPGALEHVPLPERPTELARLRALPLFVSYPPGYFGMTPLDRMGVVSLRISDFDPRRLPAVSTSFSSEGILEFLDATDSSGFIVEGGISAHILSGADLDAFIAEHRWNPDEFLGSTPAAALPVPQVLQRKCGFRNPTLRRRRDLVPLIGRDLRAPLSALSTLRVSVAPLPIGYVFWTFLPRTHCPPELRCCHPCQRRHASCDTVAGLSTAFEARDEDWLSLFRVEFWEHLGDGIFQPLLPDPRSTDLPLLGVVASPLYSDPDSPLS